MPTIRDALPWLWGALLAARVGLPLYLSPEGRFHVNHEGYSYVYRLIEFSDCLRAGYLFPQWAVDFRSGLGSPYFGYYQPGFFYVASLFALVARPVQALALAVWAFSLVGYAGAFTLVRRHFGTAAGVLAGSALLCAPYPVVDAYLRGDLSEYAGMMTLAAVLSCLVRWLDGDGQASWYGLAFGAGALVAIHPIAALLGYGTLGIVTACHVAMGTRPAHALGAAAALAVGVGLAAFYWLPLALEWSFVEAERATAGYHAYTFHFVPAQGLLGFPVRALVPVSLGYVTLLLVVVTGWRLARGWRTVAPPARRLVASLAVVALATIFMIDPASRVLWDSLPLVSLLQFPWRFLVVVTVAVSAFAACAPSRRPAVVGALLALLLLQSMSLEGRWVGRLLGNTAGARFRVASTARDITTLFFAPDGNNEWLPAGARVLRDRAVPRLPECEPACEVTWFQRTAGEIRMQIEAAGGTTIVVPHYFFPVGWRATLDDATVPLLRDERGLMVVAVPHGGIVDVTFGMTPMKRVGVLVSAVVLAGLLLALATRRAQLGAGGAPTGGQ